MSVATASKHVGGLSTASKMPCRTYNLPARRKCGVGGRLATMANSVCSRCYATRGRNGIPSVQRAADRRLSTLGLGSGSGWRVWVQSFVTLLDNDRWFRWHSAGDIQSYAHLCAIVRVAKKAPWVSFWVPTKEYGIVRAWLNKHGDFPTNLVVRVSSPLVDAGPLPSFPLTSTVTSTGDAHDGSHPCHASRTAKHCGSCRACWDRSVPDVSYKLT